MTNKKHKPELCVTPWLFPLRPGLASLEPAARVEAAEAVLDEHADALREARTQHLALRRSIPKFGQHAHLITIYRHLRTWSILCPFSKKQTLDSDHILMKNQLKWTENPSILKKPTPELRRTQSSLCRRR